MKSAVWACLGLFCAVAVTSPIHGNGIELPLMRKDADALQVSDSLLQALELYSQYTSAAYCNFMTPGGDKVKCSNNGCPGPEKNGAIVVRSFLGAVTGMGGFVATDPARSEIIVSFKGSSSFRNWLFNAMSTLDDFALCEGCQTHQGFQRAWTEVRQTAIEAVLAVLAANPLYKVISVGHSLGGAVANFAAGELRAAGVPVDIYSYGSPRPGNGALVDFITKQPGLEVRVTHLDDPVPRLPPHTLGYRHTSPELWLSTGGPSTVDYTVADILLCKGNFNLTCNGGTKTFNVDAHNYYFQFQGACNDGGFEYKRGGYQHRDRDG